VDLSQLQLQLNKFNYNCSRNACKYDYVICKWFPLWSGSSGLEYTNFVHNKSFLITAWLFYFLDVVITIISQWILICHTCTINSDIGYYYKCLNIAGSNFSSNYHQQSCYLVSHITYIKWHSWFSNIKCIYSISIPNLDKARECAFFKWSNSFTTKKAFVHHVTYWAQTLFYLKENIKLCWLFFCRSVLCKYN
jgi:hypothetical protein